MSSAALAALPRGARRPLPRAKSAFDELETAMDDMWGSIKSPNKPIVSRQSSHQYIDLSAIAALATSPGTTPANPIITANQPSSSAPTVLPNATIISYLQPADTPILPSVKKDEEYDSDTEYEDIPTLDNVSAPELSQSTRVVPKSDEDLRLDSFISKVVAEETVANRVDELAWDPDAKAFWQKRFGDRDIVSWDEFILALATDIYVQPDDILNLNKIMGPSYFLPLISSLKPNHFIMLDHNNANYISVHTFAQFLTGNGPFTRCIQKMNSYLKQSYVISKRCWNVIDTWQVVSLVLGS